MLDQRRVAEIVVLSTEKRGTGYVLCDRCILTAYHVVRGVENSTAIDAIKFRLLGDENWCNASLAWSDAEFDVALLEFTHSFSLTFDLPRLVSREAHRKRILCNAVGFPEFRKEEREKKFFDEYCLEGWIKPTDFDATKNPSQLSMEIEGSIPPTVESLQGVSGTTVFSTDGDLIGVLLKVPKNLGGQQIHVISLSWIVDRHPSFSQALRERFQQSFQADDRRRRIYRLKEESRVREKRRIVDEERQRQIKNELEELEGEEKLTGHDPDKVRLKQVLERIEQYDLTILTNSWTYLKNERMDISASPQVGLNARDICDELGIALDKTLTYCFLERVIALLQHKDLTDEVTGLIFRLRELLPLFPQPETTLGDNDLSQKLTSTDLASAIATPLLLFGLTSESEATTQGAIEYSLSIHHVPDSATYQQRVRDEDSLEEAAKPLKISEDALSGLDVRLTDRDRLAFSADSDDVEAVREILTATVQAVFETYPELEDSPPHIYFYLPKSLLTLDCHNLDCNDGLSSLGLDYPVVTTCLDRYKQQNQQLKKLWCQRWNGLNCEPRFPLRRHVCSCTEKPNGKPLSFENKKALGKQLKQLDGQGATLIGLQFANNDLKFQTICETLFATGLSLFLYPSSPLTPTEVTNLEKTLEKTCIDCFLEQIQAQYRVYSESEEDAGTLSILMDNPYLPLPEVDYF